MNERISPDETVLSAGETTAQNAMDHSGRISPINRRRWHNFKSNRRGYWSLWIFLVLFVVTLFAELIANDKPLLISYDGSFYAPLYKVYPETVFGGEFETEADYRDPYVVELIEEKGGWILWPPIRYSYDTINRDFPGYKIVDGEQRPSSYPTAPTWMMRDTLCKTPEGEQVERFCAIENWNWLGTDGQGRDVLARPAPLELQQAQQLAVLGAAAQGVEAEGRHRVAEALVAGVDDEGVAHARLVAALKGLALPEGLPG